MAYNRVQTELTEYLRNELPQELVSDLYMLIDSVPFLYNLTRPDRPKIGQTEKDEDGLVKVDITNPHILTDMDYFRPSAINWEHYGQYTNLYPNAHPNSAYSRFWQEEARRCRDGYTREDGEWIPGPYYFYLNYTPILKTKAEKGKHAGKHIVGLPDIYDGDYLLFHYIEQARAEGEHAGMLKRRGAGYSYKAGSGLARLFVLGDTSENKTNVTGFAIADQKEYLIKDGILNKFVSNVNWCADHTPWPRMKLKDSYDSMQWTMGYKNSEGLTKGIHNSIIGVTTQGDPDKARGKRGSYIYWEEWGKNPHLLKSWELARESVGEGNVSFGVMVGGGTGGTDNADFRGAEELFYQPIGYSIKALPNVFDKNAGENSMCGFFFGAYMNRLNCYDKNGNSDVIAALIEILEKRLKIKYGSSDTNTLVQHKAEMCITPQEAVLRREGNMFPVVDLKEQLSNASVDMTQFISSHYIGHLKYTSDGRVEWDNKQLHPVIREFPIKDTLDRTGNTEIFEMPRKNSEGRVPANRYIAGIDPIDSDVSTYTNSLGSIFIFDLWTDRIVAEYTGRPQRATDLYDQVLRLLRFYNAQANYENNIKGLFSYMERNNSLHYLCDTPQILKDLELMKGGMYGNTAHPYSEYIYTPSGKKQWKDIKIGDTIFTDNGQPTKVVDIPFDDFTDIYKITLFDGRIVHASENHLWDILKPCTRKRYTLSTKELLHKYERLHKSGYKVYEYLIPSSSKVDFNEQDVPIDPYILGLLLGDGTTKNARRNTIKFTSNKQDLEEYQKFIPDNYRFTIPSDDRHCFLKIPNGGHYLNELKLDDKTSINKFVPDIYKFNTSEIRLNLLKGLLDTDGSVEQGTPIFNTISKQLAEDVCFLARSLGYNSKLYLNKAGYKLKNKYVRCNDIFSIKIWTTDPLFKLSRKLNKLTKKPSGKLKVRMLGIPIVDIKYSHKDKAKCITVDNKSECYLINDFIVTHNSKGTHANKAINSWARKLQADWMISPAYQAYSDDEEIELDEQGNPIEKPQLLNLNRIKAVGYLKEAIAWVEDLNCDRVSAMGMVMILREERLKHIDRQKEEKVNNIFNDKFFTRNEFGGFNKRNKHNPKFTMKDSLRYTTPLIDDVKFPK